LASLAVVALLLVSRVAVAAPTVWAIDDGEKIKEDAPPGPLAAGTGNAVWSPGQPIRLFAMKNETVAFQIVVSADDAPLEGVTVDLDELGTADGAKIQNAQGATDPTKYVGRPIERFREHFFTVARASGSKDPRECLGWAPGSGPPAGKWTGRIPDALVPVEVAPGWLAYPMSIAPRTNAIVWIDVTVPKSQAAGLYKGSVLVRAGARELAHQPIELDVIDRTLADRPVQTMLYYERQSLERRIGKGDAAERQLWRLLHRHRISPLHGVLDIDDVDHHLPALDGSAYTTPNGYEGPGEGLGDGVLSLGTYGDFGEPNEDKLKTVERIVDHVAAKGLLATTDTFVYAKDEECESPWGGKWKRLVGSSTNPNMKKLRVAWTCNDDPSKQAVDIPILPGSFDPAKAADARAKGKEVWVYNGRHPHSGAFNTDAAAISPRVNGWLLGMFDIGRWFYWESVFWYDGNRGGKGPYDPFVSPETFHNADGDYGMGEGVLLYPGKQVDMFTSHSLGLDGVIPSIRLKNWRRGIEDAGYYQLARAADATKADAIAKELLPVVLDAAKDGKPPSWSESGKPYFDARKALLDLIKAHPDVKEATAAKSPPNRLPPGAPAGGCGRGCGSCSTANEGGSASGIGLVLALLWRRRRARRTHVTSVIDGASRAGEQSKSRR
jgi:hypothetical protein